MSETIEQRLQLVLSEIEQAAVRVGRRPEEVTLVCVSKKRSVEAMAAAAAFLHAQRREVIFGESYVQEFEKKREFLGEQCKVHLIGSLQSNKIAKAVQLFDLIESVHSEKVLRLIDTEAKQIDRVMPIFIQVNISRDAQKAGFDVSQLDQLFSTVIPLCSAVQVQGVMTITELYEDDSKVRDDFKALFRLRQQLSNKFNMPLECSMGMSADFPIAIEEGATQVRIGSAIFSQ